jgi:hypothetical protein
MPCWKPRHLLYMITSAVDPIQVLKKLQEEGQTYNEISGQITALRKHPVRNNPDHKNPKTRKNPQAYTQIPNVIPTEMRGKALS